MFSYRSIRQRLEMVVIIAVAIVLFLAGGAGLIYMFYGERQKVGQHLTSQAELLATQSVAPLLFDDKEAMRQNLGALKFVNSIRWAVVVANGKVFASYGKVPANFADLREWLRFTAAQDPVDGNRLVENEQIVVRQVILREPGAAADSPAIGEIFIMSSFAESNASFFGLVAAFAGLSLLVIAVTLPFLSMVVRQITQPLSELVGIAQRVTHAGDLSLRAQVAPLSASGGRGEVDEMEQLGRAFNQMLDGLDRHERELSALTHELQTLNANNNQVREEERTRIAREIHDELGQLLTRLKFDVSWIKASADQPQQVNQRAVEMAGFLDQAVQAVRRISWELRPGILDTLGLSAAIEWLGEELQKRSGITCRVDAEPLPKALTQDCASNLFRIAQELLTNVARHSSATEVNVMLDFSDGVTLIVEDDGVGLRRDEGTMVTLGLLGIRERVRHLDGTIEFLSTPEFKGTSVTVRIPLVALTALLAPPLADPRTAADLENV